VILSGVMCSYCICRTISILLGLIPHPTWYLPSLETLKWLPFHSSQLPLLLSLLPVMRALSVAEPKFQLLCLLMLVTMHFPYTQQWTWPDLPCTPHTEISLSIAAMALSYSCHNMNLFWLKAVGLQFIPRNDNHNIQILIWFSRPIWIKPCFTSTTFKDNGMMLLRHTVVDTSQCFSHLYL
jgi:hypothetical protein